MLPQRVNVRERDTEGDSSMRTEFITNRDPKTGRILPDSSSIYWGLPLRFWSKVYADPSGCWLWASSLGRGYGLFWLKRYLPAHRLSYECLVGPIPEGLTLDHLCRVRRCLNPLHLEAVTLRENILRGTSPTAHNARKVVCLRGHALKGRSKVGRHCQACHSLTQNQRRARERLG